VTKKAVDLPPRIEATFIFSTFSPSANAGNGFDAVSTVKVVSAVMILGTVVNKLTLAVAVEFSPVPAKAVLLYVDKLPLLGVTVTLITVPTGTFDAANPTVTGLVVEDGRVISGGSNTPTGDEGTAVPATVVMESEGMGKKLTSPGEEIGGLLVIVPVNP
jgi:hypothetical protein